MDRYPQKMFLFNGPPTCNFETICCSLEPGCHVHEANVIINKTKVLLPQAQVTFGLLLPKLKIISLSNLLILSVSYEGYSRNAQCALNLISTFLFHKKKHVTHFRVVYLIPPLQSDNILTIGVVVPEAIVSSIQASLRWIL